MADWSSVFEASGEEVGEWERDEFSSEGSRANILHLLQNYNPLVAYFFTVNYVLGVGCLGIPFAFQSCGLILGIIVITFATFVSYLTVLFVAEVPTRRERACDCL